MFVESVSPDSTKETVLLWELCASNEFLLGRVGGEIQVLRSVIWAHGDCDEAIGLRGHRKPVLDHGGDSFCGGCVENEARDLPKSGSRVYSAWNSAAVIFIQPGQSHEGAGSQGTT